MLNDEIATLFKNWSLPNLNTLNVAKNHITDKGIKLWINKQNMPQLEVLALCKNTLKQTQTKWVMIR
jgi:Ran GTPase-activating protein (RanGAP) involved in mRNA processing and transport